MQYPKFEQAIQDRVVNSALEQTSRPGYGIILSYDKITNTASVLLSVPGSGNPGEQFNDVPCPTTLGLQMQAPYPGRPCWVTFKDGNQAFPVVSHFFNHVFDQTDYLRQYNATNNIPRYLYSV